MQTATTIEADVDNDTIALVVLTQYLAVNLAIAGIVHRLDVNISQTTARDTVDDVLVVFNPALVEEVVECAATDGFNHLFPSLAGGRVAEAYKGLHTSLPVEHDGVVVLVGDLLSIDFLYYASRANFRLGVAERSSSHHFGNFESFAGVAHVVEQTQVGC